MIKTAFTSTLTGFAMTFAAMAANAATPAPPTNLCIQDSAGTSCATSAPVSTGTKKWNPGHYVRPDMAAWASTADARQAVYALTKGNSNLKGGLVMIPWGSLETSQGVYDFSQIDKDLAYLKSIGKKLIIEVWWQKYGCSSGNDTRYFPAYIYNAGGVGTLSALNECHININQQQWADRYIALQTALAARYDNDPDVEQVVITETASTSAVIFKTMVPAVAKLWKKTGVVLYMNWVDSGSLAAELAAICAANGVGIGGPDILPPKPLSPYGEDHGSKALRGVGVVSADNDGSNMQNFGTVDYRGKIPVQYSYEAAYSILPTNLIGYTRDTLKATHVVWMASEYYSGGLNWLAGVLPMLQSTGYPIVTARPTSWQ